MNAAAPRLPLYEWIIVALIITIVLLLTAVTVAKDHAGSGDSFGTPHQVLKNEIEVSIHGAVKYPGTYKLKRQASIKELFELAQPLPDANIKTLLKRKRLRDGEVININIKE